VKAGKLRYRATIEAAQTVQNAYGEPVEGWATFAEVWASKEDLTIGTERFASDQILAQQPTRFICRYVANVTTKMRINCEGISYNVESVADADGRKRSLSIIAIREG